MRLESVAFRYHRRGPWVLKDVTLALPAGSVTEVTGRNGAGKSTLLRLIAGLRRPHKGAVHDRPSRVGYAPERFPVDQPFVVRSYLHHMSAIRGVPPSSLNTWTERLGLEHLLDVRLPELSKGSAQKVGLVQALMDDPGLLILDEPFAGLDAATRDSLPSLIAELAAGGTTVVISDHQRTIEKLPNLGRIRVANSEVVHLPSTPPTSTQAPPASPPTALKTPSHPAKSASVSAAPSAPSPNKAAHPLEAEPDKTTPAAEPPSPATAEPPSSPPSHAAEPTNKADPAHHAEPATESAESAESDHTTRPSTPTRDTETETRTPTTTAETTKHAEPTSVVQAPEHLERPMATEPTNAGHTHQHPTPTTAAEVTDIPEIPDAQVTERPEHTTAISPTEGPQGSQHSDPTAAIGTTTGLRHLTGPMETTEHPKPVSAAERPEIHEQIQASEGTGPPAGTRTADDRTNGGAAWTVLTVIVRQDEAEAVENRLRAEGHDVRRAET